MFPILSLLLLYLCDPVQLLLGDKTWTKLEDEHTHGTLAAMIQISVVFTTLVFVLDLFGVYYTSTSDYLAYDSHAVFYVSTVTGLIVDVAAFVWVVFVIVSTCQCNCRRLIRSMRNQDAELNNSARVKKLFSTVTIAPILCLSNHFHYIVIAFMADPFHAGSTLIVYILSFFLFFFIFKQFYNRVVLHSNKRPKIISRMELCPKCSVREKLWNPLSSRYQINEEADEGAGPINETENRCNCFIPGPNCHAPFNIQVVVLGILTVAPILVLYESIIIILFVTLPISKSIEDAPSRIYVTYQGTGLLIVALLTYNIVLNPTPFSIAKTIERLAKRLRLPENTNFWNRLSIEEKLAKVLVTLLETHFHNTLGFDKKKGTKQNGNVKDVEKDDDGTIAASSSRRLQNDAIQLHIYSSGSKTETEITSVGDLRVTEI